MDKVIIKIKDGKAIFIYDDKLRPLMNEGLVKIERASHVEPNEDGKWVVDLSPLGYSIELGPFESRNRALLEEVQWIEENILNGKV